MDHSILARERRNEIPAHQGGKCVRIGSIEQRATSFVTRIAEDGARVRVRVQACVGACIECRWPSGPPLRRGKDETNDELIPHLRGDFLAPCGSGKIALLMAVTAFESQRLRHELHHSAKRPRLEVFDARQVRLV